MNKPSLKTKLEKIEFLERGRARDLLRANTSAERKQVNDGYDLLIEAVNMANR